MTPLEVRDDVWLHARALYRDMPWRQDTRPYYVLVSEVMLQQTQVSRVMEKFQSFIARFPTIESLAQAPLAEVLTSWSGLGYNRRAKFLHRAAQQVMERHAGVIPDNLQQLVQLPGIGANTAGAILVYSFNQPVVFVETNVRTVMFHYFFADQEMVTDADIRRCVEQVIDQEHPREFYWGLMDYGAELKRQGIGRLDKSRHYKKQSPLKGSLREVRGMILKALVSGGLHPDELAARMPADDRYQKALDDLVSEGLVVRDQQQVRLAA